MRIRLLTLLIAMCAPLVPGNVAAQPFTFYFLEQQLQRSSFGAFGWADLGGDAAFDIVLTGNRSILNVPEPQVSVEMNRGLTETPRAGKPVPGIVYEAGSGGAAEQGVWLSMVALADVDQDGDLDAYISGATGGATSYSPSSALLSNDGSGGLQPVPSSFVPLYAGSAFWLDVDNDGQPDLLTSGIDASGTFRTLFYQNERGSFSEVDLALPGLANTAVAAADYDGDGDVDVVISGREATGRFVTRLLSNAEGVLVDSGVDLIGVAYGSLDWGDMDNDGDPDLLVTGGQIGPLVLSGVTRIYRNDNGALVDVGNALPGLLAGSARWGDYNLDGRLDIVWSGATNLFAAPATRVYQRMDDGSYQHRVSLGGAFPSMTEWGDFDGDGDLDLSVQGMDALRQPMLLQYQNGERLVNNAPAPPSSLVAAPEGNGVTFQWAAASDTETPVPGLSYNVRVGTEPGQADILNAYADAGTGRRAMSRPGNAGQNLSWSLRDLSPGAYFWSVQAIDGAYQASRFAPEGAFTIRENAGGSVGTSAEADTPAPSTFSLAGNYPNPFREKTSIRFSVPREEGIRLEIYDVLGSRVRTLLAERVAPGDRAVAWDARNDSGGMVPAGVYIYRLSASSGWADAGKMIVVR